MGLIESKNLIIDDTSGPKCKNTVCKKLTGNINLPYCYNHICHWNGCKSNNSSPWDDYCKKHTCGQDMCPNSISGKGSLFCSQHESN